MGKITLASIQQPLSQPGPKTNMYEGREVDLGRIRAQVQGGPEIHNGAAAGLANLAQGLSAWTGVARAWASRQDQTEERPAGNQDGSDYRRALAKELGDQRKDPPELADHPVLRGLSRAKAGKKQEASKPADSVSKALDLVRSRLKNEEADLAASQQSATPEAAQINRDQDLDRAGLLESLRIHNSALSVFLEKQAELNGRQAIDDPLTGQPGLVDRTRKWIEDYEQKVKPKFRWPLTEEIYDGMIKRSHEQLLAQSEALQTGEEEAWREEVFEADLEQRIETMFQDPDPQRLADLEEEITTLWPEPESAGRRAEVRDRSYGRIAQKMLEAGNLNEAEAFINQYQGSFKPETAEALQKDLDRKEAELSLSHTALTEVLPDLAADEIDDIIAKGRGSQNLDGLYQSAEEFWGLPAGVRGIYQTYRQEAQAAREWLDRPENAFKPFSELLAQAERELGQEGDGEHVLNRHSLARQEIRRRQQEFNDDPIGYVAAQRDQTLGRLAGKGLLGKDLSPAQVQMRIALGRSLAKKMGMEDQGQVLSSAEVAQYREQLAQAAAPADRVKLLAEYQRLFGRYADRAFNQLDISAEERLAVLLHRHPRPEVRELVLLGLDRTVEPAEPWLESLAHNEADSSSYGRELMGRLVDSDWEDDQAWEELGALRNLSATVVAAGMRQGHPRPGRLAAKLVEGLSEMSRRVDTPLKNMAAQALAGREGEAL